METNIVSSVGNCGPRFLGKVVQCIKLHLFSAPGYKPAFHDKLGVAMNDYQHSATLVGLEAGRIAIFGTGPEAPSKRSFAEWKARGYFPSVKLGKRVFINPIEVRRALERRFTINAREI